MKRNTSDVKVLTIAIVIIIVILEIIYVLNTYDMRAQRDLLESETVSIRLDLSVSDELVTKLKEDALENERYNSELHDKIENMSEILEEYESSYTFVNNYNPTDKEMTILYKIVESEATGQNFESRVNVAHVILNRVESDYFPDSIKKVVFQENQFSPINDNRYYEVIVTKKTIDAVNYAINGDDTTYGSLYFMNRSASDSENVTWFDSNLRFTMRDDSGHEFFTSKY